MYTTDRLGRVIIVGNKLKHGWIDAAYKLNKNTKGHYVNVNKKKVYVEGLRHKIVTMHSGYDVSQFIIGGD